MGVIERSLVDRCVRRALDEDGTPYTEYRLVERCSLDISYSGPDARTSVRMKGVRGYRLKNCRRLMPSGPLGVIKYSSPGLLHIDFPSVALLAALRTRSAANHALASFFTDPAGDRYPGQMPVELGVKFALEHIDVGIDQDVVEALIQSNPPGPFGNSQQVISGLLEVAHLARARRWKRVDLDKWRSAGLMWPLLRKERARPATPTPLGTIYRVSERSAKLLRLFDQADDADRALIEMLAARVVAGRPAIAT